MEEWRRQKRQTKKRVCSDCNIQQKTHLKSLDICWLIHQIFNLIIEAVSTKTWFKMNSHLVRTGLDAGWRGGGGILIRPESPSEVSLPMGVNSDTHRHPPPIFPPLPLLKAVIGADSSWLGLTDRQQQSTRTGPKRTPRSLHWDRKRRSSNTSLKLLTNLIIFFLVWEGCSRWGARMCSCWHVALAPCAYWEVSHELTTHPHHRAPWPAYGVTYYFNFTCRMHPNEQRNNLLNSIFLYTGTLLVY